MTFKRSRVPHSPSLPPYSPLGHHYPLDHSSIRSLAPDTDHSPVRPPVASQPNHRRAPSLCLWSMCQTAHSTGTRVGMCVPHVAVCVPCLFHTCGLSALSHHNCLEHLEDMTSQRGNVGRWRVFCGRGKLGCDAICLFFDIRSRGEARGASWLGFSLM